MALRAWNILELCAGAGGLGLGIKLAVPHARGVAYVEREAAAAATLVTRMEAGDLAPAPVWSDLATFDPDPWRGRIHCVASGDPCQPNSVAGKGLGAADERFLIDQVLRIVAGCRPLRLFRENVTGNAAGQLAALVPALERMGYRVEAGIFSSAASGNSHGRERLVLMADRADGAGWLYPRPWRPGEDAGDAGGVGERLDDTAMWGRETRIDVAAGKKRWVSRPGGPAFAGDGGCGMADADCVGGTPRDAGAPERSGPEIALDDRDDLADADVARSSQRIGDQERRRAMGDEGPSAGTGGDFGFPVVAPGPGDARWAAILDADPMAAPAIGRFDLWTLARRNLGLAPLVDAIGRRGGMARDLDAQTTAAAVAEVRRMADAMADRVERLRQLGNGVDPVVGWDAWVHLDARHRARREQERAGHAAVTASAA